MTQDEIIEMAREAGMMTRVLYLGRNLELLETFAKLVAQHEREACAEICKKHADVYALLEQNPHSFGTAKPAWAACIDNRDTILARGQA
jgi:hypothetical protein